MVEEAEIEGEVIAGEGEAKEEGVDTEEEQSIQEEGVCHRLLNKIGCLLQNIKCINQIPELFFHIRNCVSNVLKRFLSIFKLFLYLCIYVSPVPNSLLKAYCNSGCFLYLLKLCLIRGHKYQMFFHKFLLSNASFSNEA